MMQPVYTPPEEIHGRVKKIQSLMKQRDLDGLVIIHHINMFYFSGTSQNGFLFIPQTGVPLLLVRKSYERAKIESSIDLIIDLKGLKSLMPTIESHLGHPLKAIGIELDVIPYNTVMFYQNKVFPKVALEDGAALMKMVRQTKSKWEIDLLTHSCRVLDNAFSTVPEMIEEGMAEIELASLFEGYLRRHGYGGCSKMRAFNQDFLFGNLVSGSSGKVATYFDGPVGGQGLSPANNPHGAGWKKILKNEPVYIDYTCVVNGYTADAQRVFVLGSQPLDKMLLHAHDTALQIQDEVIRQLKPGVMCSEIWELSEQIVKRAGLMKHFMGFGSDQVKFLGHGVGLELDEWPVFARGFDLALEEGMTFALEPKFVFEQGAVGIENTFALKKNGVEKLNGFPEQIVYI